MTAIGHLQMFSLWTRIDSIRLFLQSSRKALHLEYKPQQSSQEKCDHQVNSLQKRWHMWSLDIFIKFPNLVCRIGTLIVRTNVAVQADFVFAFPVDFALLYLRDLQNDSSSGSLPTAGWACCCEMVPLPDLKERTHHLISRVSALQMEVVQADFGLGFPLLSWSFNYNEQPVEVEPLRRW